MKFRVVVAAAAWLAAALSCALADSTVDPTVPAQGGELASAPIRANFAAARADINNLLGQFAGISAPANPTVGQVWRKTSVLPNVVYQWTGTSWAQVATFDTIVGAVTPYFGSRVLAWQELLSSLGVPGQCIVSTGASSPPTAQSCFNATNFLANAPLSMAFVGATGTASLNYDSNFTTTAGSLALASVGAGQLLCNTGASSAEPSACSWNGFANRAISPSPTAIPMNTSGTWGAVLANNSVANPGTNTLEALQPIQTTSGASKTFAVSDLFKETRRLNSGSAMTDTLPVAGATGLVNGTWFVVTNADATGSITLAPGSGTQIAGSGVIPPGRSVRYVYDVAGAAWRPQANADTALLTTPQIAHQWVAGVSNGVAVQSQPSFSDIAGILPAGAFPALTGDATTAAGSLATTLATVNANTGTFGSATAVPLVTLDGKGRVIAASQAAIPTASSSQSGLSKCDGTTITCPGGTFTAIGAATTAIDASGATSISNGSAIGGVLVNNSGKVGNVSATSWFDSAYCSTVGYIIVRATGTWTCAPGIPANAAWWGVACDGSTDTTAALQSAVNALANKVLLLPNGLCLVSGTITSSSPIIIRGQGYGAGPGQIQYNTGTEVITSSAFTTGDIFVCATEYACVFQDIQINALTARTAGAAIHITGSSSYSNANSVIERVSFASQYIDIQESAANVTTVRATYHQAWSRAALYTEAIGTAEPGGGFISGNYFFGNTASGTAQAACVEFHSGYEMFFNNLVLGCQVGINVVIDQHDAGGLKFTNNWIEEQTVKGIHVSNGNSHAVTLLQIIDNEFSVVTNGSTLQSEISLESGSAPYLTNVTITGNTFRSNLSYTGTPIYINMQTGQNVLVANNTINDLNSTTAAYGIVVNGAQAAQPVLISDNTFLGWTNANLKYIGVGVGVVKDSIGLTASILPTSVSNGSQIFVSDGTPGTACTSGGTGSMGFKQGGTWKCL